MPASSRHFYVCDHSAHGEMRSTPSAMPSILRVMPTPAVMWMVGPHIADTWRSISRLHINNTRRRSVSRSGRRCHHAATDCKRQCSSRNQSQGFHHIHTFCQKYTQLLQVDRHLWPSIRSFIFRIAERYNFPQIQGLQLEKITAVLS